MLIHELTEASFTAFVEDHAAAGTPVLVDFTGAGCSRCRALLPVLSDLALDYRDRIAVAKVDVDAAPALAALHGVMTLPTVVLFQAGDRVTVLAGHGGRPELVAALENVA